MFGKVLAPTLENGDQRVDSRILKGIIGWIVINLWFDTWLVYIGEVKRWCGGWAFLSKVVKKCTKVAVTVTNLLKSGDRILVRAHSWCDTFRNVAPWISRGAVTGSRSKAWKGGGYHESVVQTGFETAFTGHFSSQMDNDLRDSVLWTRERESSLSSSNIVEMVRYAIFAAWSSSGSDFSVGLKRGYY